MTTITQTPVPTSNSYDAEYKLLCIFAQHKDTLGFLAEKIIPEYFTDLNRTLYIAISELYHTGLTIDLITLRHVLHKLPNGTRIPEQVAKGLFQPVDVDKVEAYLSIVSENYKTRNYISMVSEIQRALASKSSSAQLAEIVGKYSANCDLGVSRPRGIDIVASEYESEIIEGIAEGGMEKRLLKFHLPTLDRHDSMRPGNIYTFAGRPGQGKGQRNTEIVLTKLGWKRICDLKIGEQMVSVDGEESILLGIFPLGMRELYKVFLADGRVAEVTEEHLWEVNGSKVISTIDIMNSLLVRDGRRFFIPEVTSTREAGRAIEIVAITKSGGFDECSCIRVSHPRQLYITRDYIVTHNTSSSIQTSYHLAFGEKKRVVFFSLEMQGAELLEKLFCYHYQIDSNTWMKIPHRKKLAEVQSFKSLLISGKVDLIIDDNCKDLQSIVTRINAINAQKKADLVVIDYIQLVSCKGGNNRTDQIETVMNTIKTDIAMKHKVAVICLSQMSKAIEKDGHRMPTLADLLGGGSIEATSTSVYFVHSIPITTRRYFDDEGQLENRGEHLFVAQKARYGKKGILKMWFVGGVNRFVETESEQKALQSEMEGNCRRILTP